MKLQVFHETSYRYEQPVRRSIQMLRMTPAKTQRQNVLNCVDGCLWQSVPLFGT